MRVTAPLVFRIIPLIVAPPPVAVAALQDLLDLRAVHAQHQQRALVGHQVEHIALGERYWDRWRDARFLQTSPHDDALAFR